MLSAMKTMTSRQSWAIFCLSKRDVRKAVIGMEKASELIDALKAGGERFKLAIDFLDTTEGVQKKGDAAPKQDWQAIFDEAHKAGMLAGQGFNPEPMIVEGRSNPLDDKAPVCEQYFVPDGVCGFAWVVVRPGNCSFAVWARKNGLAKSHYYGGVSFWVSSFGQSMQRKEAYAQAFADVLNKYGIKASAQSRMD